jgi:hypothetical protein
MVKKYMHEKGEIKEKFKYKKIIILSLVLLVLIVVFLIYLLYPFTKECYDKECFSESLVNCEKAQWINDDQDATWFYSILGEKDRKCEIKVKLLQTKKGGLELRKIEGTSMVCELPLKTMLIPEQNLEKCHGLLKEGLQDLIIKKMHSYILENIGEITKNITALGSI